MQKTAARHAIPVLGINLGNLGFLTEFREDETFTAIEKILHNKVRIEHRLMLKTRLISSKANSESRYALNDIVISKMSAIDFSTSPLARTMSILQPTGQMFNFLVSDSSTAYNLSAGGPLVYPGLATITVTPICPFMLSSRPIILPAHKQLTTTYEAQDKQERAQIIIDGQPFMEMEPDDKLEVSTAKHPLQLVASGNRDYSQFSATS